MAKRKRSTPEEQAQIVKLSQEGKTGEEISQATGFSVPTIYNILKKHRSAKPKGRRGRPKKTASMNGGSFRDVIRQIVREEVQNALREAFK